MNNIRLFRRRFIPDEITELKDDTILSISDNIIITKWDVLKPRRDISCGISAYFIDKGIKVSKIYDSNHNLVYWYCDIIQTVHDEGSDIYTFNDLLIDVLVYPDGTVRVVDMDEFADVMDNDILDNHTIAAAMRDTSALLDVIYSGHFNQYTDYITNTENM